MCPTEIFFDPAEEAYIRLLPIETRKREDSIASLKQHPVEWVKIKLNLQSHDEMAKAMASLAETRQVRVEEASALGLLDQKDFVTQRQAAIEGFRNGAVQVLVATDIASRGSDVSRISHVINYDMPDTADAYTHRIGRTGRAEKNGDAFTFMTREDGAMVHSIERALGKKVERRMLPCFDYKKPAPARGAEFARLPRVLQARKRRGPKVQG